MNIIKSIIHKFGKWYCKKVCEIEYKKRPPLRLNERPIEYSFVFRQLSRFCPSAVLDVGTGKTALPHLIRNCGFNVTAIDNIHDYWTSGMFNRHYHVIDDDISNTKLKKTFDFINCVSVLEHIQNFNNAVKNMFNLLNPNGYILLTFPYNENTYIHNVYKLPGAGYGQNFPHIICQVFSRNELDNWINSNGGIIIEQEYWQFWEGEFWTFGKQLSPPVKVNKNDRHQLTCILIQKK